MDDLCQSRRQIGLRRIGDGWKKGKSSTAVEEMIIVLQVLAEGEGGAEKGKL